MKLELKHLAPYLPYGLKIKFNVSDSIGMLEYINTKRCFAGSVEEESPTDEYYLCDYIDNIKPILRPLSDLTKEIEVNGEKFVPMIELSKIIHSKEKLVTYSVMDNIGYYGVLCDWGITFETNLIYYQEIKSWYVKVNGKICTQYDTYNLFQKLFEWHFDVFSLIDNGLALDYNQINA